MRTRFAIALSLAVTIGCSGSLKSSGHGGGTGTLGPGAAGQGGIAVAGASGRGGASAGGSGGTTGTAGSTGATGTAGAGGAGVPFTCSFVQDLTCGSSALTLMNGHVTNFSPQEWSPATGQFCDAGGLRGSPFSYSGPAGGGSSNAVSVDSATGSLRLTLTAAGPGGYAGGGLSFDRCVRVPAANALRFTAWIASGDRTGCNLRAMLQTYEQRPSTQSPPGGCASDVSSCYNFPTSPNINLTTTPTQQSVAISAFTTSVAHAVPIESQIIGLQWQLDSPAPVVDGGGPQISCTVEVHIDDIDFIEP